MSGGRPVPVTARSGSLSRRNSLGFTNGFPVVVVFQQQVRIFHSASRMPNSVHDSMPISFNFATIFSLSKTPRWRKTSFPFESKKTNVGINETL